MGVCVGIGILEQWYLCAVTMRCAQYGAALPHDVYQQDAMQAEAAEMVEESFGKIILHTIGRIYTLQSAIYLGNFFEAQAAKMRQSVCTGDCVCIMPPHAVLAITCV